jgi:outer membrane biosynthesis protein TonB
MKLVYTYRCAVTLVAVVVAGCATQSTHKPYYAAPVEDVSGYDAMRYWIQEPPQVGSRQTPAPGSGGCASVELTIDSNGVVQNLQVHRFIGAPEFERWLVGHISQFKYRPSVHNTARIPIHTTMDIAIQSHPSQMNDQKQTIASEQDCLGSLRSKGIVPSPK